ncbi:universal stress protein [Halobacterium litoreum]|uniref:Universal stress protein n=1 Tax=Halobacterium litoreum TaxID=2039234 RepID=A0ABD5NJ69_9EURY|nr:universal stress protein [Halobacterium litoreum]UHH12222.1 universal stress protein [Halobacterium litoreum]
MDRAIAVVEASDSAKSLVQEAGELAAGVDAELILLHVTTEDEYSERRESMASIPDLDVNYTIDEAVDGARKFATDIGRDVLEDVDVETEPVGRIGDKGDEVLELAAERDADHIFVAGRKRSPTGKAIFGDVTQRIILEFDGAVTVVTT